MIEHRGGAPAALTPHASVNTFVAELHRRMRDVLGDALGGLYLDGSLALGDFDDASDIDFVAVTRRRISQQTFLHLQAMHRELAQLDSPWAVQHEGSYLSRAELRRYAPARCSHPNIERGAGEILKWATHDAVWNVHRWILRERGIIVFGPPPVEFIDSIDVDALRAAMHRCMQDWPGRLLRYPHLPIGSVGYQSYIVLTLCRMLCTIETGAIRSKRIAAQWASEALDEPWATRIAWAWHARSHPDEPAAAGDEVHVREFIAMALERASASAA